MPKTRAAEYQFVSVRASSIRQASQRVQRTMNRQCAVLLLDECKDCGEHACKQQLADGVLALERPKGS